MNTSFEEYKKHYEDIIKLWEDSKEILGNQLGELLEQLKLTGLAALAESAVDIVLTVIPAYLIQNPNESKGLGYNAAVRAKEAANKNMEQIESFQEFNNRVFYDILSGKITKPRLAEHIDFAYKALTKEPKRLPEAIERLSATSASMGKSLTDNKNVIKEAIDLPKYITNPKEHMQYGAQLFNSLKNAEFHRLKQTQTAAVKIIEELQHLSSKQISSPAGLLHYFADLKGKLEEAINSLKLSAITHPGKHIESNITNKAQYLNDIQACMAWEMPSVQQFSNSVHGMLRVASDLIGGRIEFTEDLRTRMTYLRDRTLDEGESLKRRFQEFSIQSMEKYASRFFADTEHLAESLNADRLQDRIQAGDIGEIANMTTLTSTFEGFMCDQLSKMRRSSNSKLTGEILQAMDLVYTEFLAEHNVKMMSGAKYMDNAGKLEEVIRETKAYIAEMEGLWSVIQNAIS